MDGMSRKRGSDKTLDVPKCDPWPDHRCPTNSMPTGILPLLAQTLDDARDEKPLQLFLARHTHLLTCLLPPGREGWCWDRPRLGAEFVPDFLLCTRNSTGIHWVLVELESPTRPPLNQSGLPSGKLAEALGQIRDWRAWLRQNIAYAQQQLGFADLNAECPAYVIIGRRSSLQSRSITKFRELSDNRTTVMTYDRLLDAVGRGRTAVGVANEQR